MKEYSSTMLSRSNSFWLDSRGTMFRKQIEIKQIEQRKSIKNWCNVDVARSLGTDCTIKVIIDWMRPIRRIEKVCEWTWGGWGQLWVWTKCNTIAVEWKVWSLVVSTSSTGRTCHRRPVQSRELVEWITGSDGVASGLLQPKAVRVSTDHQWGYKCARSSHSLDPGAYCPRLMPLSIMVIAAI